MNDQTSIGSTNLSSTESTALTVVSPDTESPISAATISSTTTEPPMPTDSDTWTDFEHPQTTILSTSMIAIQTTGQQESHETTMATIISSTGV